MPHESRRAARAAAEQQQAAAVESRRHRRRKVSRIIWLIVALLLIVLLAAACWVAFRAVTVKDALEKSQSLITDIENGADAKTTVAEIATHAKAAADAADDPVWQALEFIPWAGDNLRGVRLASEALDVVVNDVAMPVLNASDNGEPLLQKLMTVAQEQSDTISDLATQIDAVQESSALIGPVKKGVDQVDEVISMAAPVVKMLPSLLGAEGAKNYLLVFQNNAESEALGGSAAAQTLVNVDNGSVTMSEQGNSRTYQNGTAVDVPVDQSAITLYTDYLVNHINTSMSRPDFPTAAQIMKAWWQRDISPDQIDGVISVDPLALARILVATGPVTLPSGDTLSSDNAVSLLLSEVYQRWDSYKYPELVDGFFASAAKAVFDKVAAGDFNIKDMLWAINASAQQGSILVWSEDPDITAAISGQRVSGVLPTDNTDATTLGVYFHNSNGSKIDYYTKATVDASAVCTDGTSTFTVNAGLTLPITLKEAKALPRYVQSMTFGVQFRDWIFVYGPPGTTLTDATVNGEDVSVMYRDIDDLGRPVVAFEAWFDPEDTVSVTATFSGAGDFGPLAVQTNPMINTTPVTVNDSCTG